MAGLKRLSVVTTVGMFLLLLSGSLVTNTGSAEGCGNAWPFCDGDWASIATLIEANHRLITGVLGLLILALSVLAWRAFPQRREIRRLVGASVFFLLLQSFLGAAAVMWGSPPAIMATHFGISLAAFGAVLLLAVRIFEIDGTPGGDPERRPYPVDPALHRQVLAALFLTLVVVYVGAYVRHTGAGLACQGWPLCNGSLFPGLSGPVGVSFLHRLLAGFLLVYVAGVGHQGRAYRATRPDVYRACLGAVVLLGLQALTGVLIVATNASIAANMLHAAFLILYAGDLLYLGMKTAGGAAEPVRRADPLALS